MPQKPEILAPVGNEEMLCAAVYSGANAVYLGLEDFNARKGAGNFSQDALLQAISFCHTFGVKAYVVLNTIVFKNEFSALSNAIAIIYKAGADAVIVQDLATAFLCKKIAPSLALHASTQLSCTNLSGAVTLKKMGFSRVILARELSKSEIEHITKNCGVETEVFVHGAMCMGVSGQCFLSAFLGGRSGNRGECAGPCRLPFSVRDGVGMVKNEDGDFHLSLKDQSLVDYLPLLAEMGVASVKIEGRLRSAEYVAAAVNACASALAHTEYDKALLTEIFSRNGFSSGYFNSRLNGEMFGVRSKDDASLTRAAMPKLRGLYRRPIQSVGIDISLCITQNSLSLTLTDTDGNTVTQTEDCILQKANSDNFAEGAEKSLAKLGNTPFFAKNISVSVPPASYLPLSQINELRRTATEKLSALRGAKKGMLPCEYTLPEFLPKKSPAALLFARFSTLGNIPQDILNQYDKIIVPLAEASNSFGTVKAFSEKLIIELPRGVFGDDTATKLLVDKAMENGFYNFEINNIGDLAYFEGNNTVNLYSGLGMNITNPISSQVLADMGVKGITVSPEAKLSDVKYITPTAQTGVIGYGHLPLMITRACPLHNIASCKNCSKKATLRDRKGKSFDMLCTGAIRHIYNPVPLYMGDRQREIFCDFITLYFTKETAEQAKAITLNFISAKGFDGEYTRGLYY